MKTKQDCLLIVLKHLKEYQGEEIIKNEHPLHQAIQKLEERCEPLFQSSSKQKYQLFAPARNIWYKVLRACRAGNKRILRLEHPRLRDGRKHPGIARQYAQELIKELEHWMESLTIGYAQSRCTYHARKRKEHQKVLKKTVKRMNKMAAKLGKKTYTYSEWKHRMGFLDV